MNNYDVLFMHNHFVLVTTVVMEETDDQESIEQAALKRLADEYGDEFMEIIKSSKQVTIEGVDKQDDSDVYTIPEPGDPEDAGIDRD
jgi:division protein CdvB (Snf7/Vps24/ESCRT-III family)